MNKNTEEVAPLDSAIFTKSLKRLESLVEELSVWCNNGIHSRGGFPGAFKGAETVLSNLRERYGNMPRSIMSEENVQARLDIIEDDLREIGNKKMRQNGGRR